METNLAHIQFNITADGLPFYKDLFGFLEWTPIYDADGVLGVSDKNETSLWFMPFANGAANDYDGAGMNHIGIRAASQAEVDQTVAYLQEHGVQPLFDTPRHRPEFSESEDHTYYQVMFETPDRILFEVVYTGPK